MVSLVVRATERCDSRCAYCERRVGSRRTLSPEALALLFRRIGEYLGSDPTRRVEVLWHGGEPLLLGERFFGSVLDAQREACGPAARVTHAIQTNLQRLSPEVLEALRALGVRSIGTSFDPDPTVRGPRAPAGGVAHQRSFLEGVLALDHAGVPWSVIYVVTRASLGEPLAWFHALANLNLPARVTVTPVLVEAPERAASAISGREYADCLGAIARAWARHRARFAAVEPLAGLADGLRRTVAAPPEASSEAPTDAILQVAPDLEVSPSRRPSRHGGARLGSLADRPIADALAENARAQRDERARKLAGECRGCRHWRSCLGGCALDVFAQSERADEVGEWCDARRYFVRAYLEPLLEANHAELRA